MNSEIRGLALPSPKSAPPGAGPTTNVQSEGPIVVVGANGSGKTRLGTWIEFESVHTERVRRISAQKSLAIIYPAPQYVESPGPTRGSSRTILAR